MDPDHLQFWAMGGSKISKTLQMSFAHCPPAADLRGQDPGERAPEQRGRHPHHEPAVGQEGQLQRPPVLAPGEGVWSESGMGCSIAPTCFQVP